MIDLSAAIAGVPLAPCIMNGPGPKSVSYDDLVSIAKSRSGAIVTASMTIEPGDIGPEPNYYHSPQASVIAPGFPNLGYKEYIKMIPDLRALGKPVIASITGSNLSEFVDIAAAVSLSKPDIIQLDLSQPERPKGIYDVAFGDRPIGYFVEKVERLIAETRRVAAQPVGILLPGFLDPMAIRSWSIMLQRTGLSFIALLPPVNVALMIDPETESNRLAVSTKFGVGMMGGAGLKPVSLAEIRVFRQELNPPIPIVGSGGVQSGTDVYEYLLTGASAVQVTDALLVEGVGVFARLESELAELLIRKGRQNASGAVGQLRIPTSVS